jgi:Family of unknown function (DUF6353)
MSLVPVAVGKLIARNVLLTQKASPELLFGAGLVGSVTSTVLACRATLKADAVVRESKVKLRVVKTLEAEEYSEKDRRKDVSLVYFQTSVKVTRLYGPAILVGGFSIVALTRSHNILTQRNAALTAAYVALDKGFREYRTRVIAKYGEDADRDFRYGTRELTIEDPETGKKTKTVRVNPGDPSIYARWFDNGSSEWSKEPEYNLAFLKATQNYCNDLLHARGHVFLNEVYDMLGLERSKAGAVVGWLLTKNGSTDNFVNFGIFDDRERARDFVNGFEGAILLDFNVDGLIYDKLDNIHREALSWQRGKSLNK